MASGKEKRQRIIVFYVCYPLAIIAIILSLTGIMPLSPLLTYGGIAVLLFTAFATYNSSKKKRQK